MVLETLLTGAPQGELPALILADATLAQACGWDHLVPVLAQGLSRADLGKRGEDLRLACHQALISSTVEVVRQASDLVRRAARMKTVAPKLRAKDEVGFCFLAHATLARRFGRICMALLAGEPIKAVADRFDYTSVSNSSSRFGVGWAAATGVVEPADAPPVGAGPHASRFNDNPIIVALPCGLWLLRRIHTLTYCMTI